MVKAPRSVKTSLKRRPWSPEEDQKLINYIKSYGIWIWTEMPKPAGLSRSGKSCRLRWLNYLRPGIKLGNFSQKEDQIIIKLHEQLGNKWSRIAARLPGRTDNDIKNHWHTHLKKRLTNNQVPSTSSKRRQKATVEVNYQNINLPEIDRSLPNYLLNLNGCRGPPSSLLNPETDGNQMTEANNFSYKQIQSLSERLSPVEGWYSDYEAAFAYTEYMVLTSQWELLEDMYNCYDGGFDLWD